MPDLSRILGIEGTAWNLSAAVFDDDLVSLFSHPYSPLKGGIHPRDAAQHHASMMAQVIAEALPDPGTIEGVAFSQGPGLGPCLRTVATAARILSLSLKIPLIGVNHCIAHIEIGRFDTGLTDPVVLYVSGANTQVIGYLNKRYRIFGETLDIGLGNALDKFARSKEFPHPGGPVIEDLAKSGSWIPLPYTVKGMDLAFSGLVSAAKESPSEIEDVCYSLQETAFAMCTEVEERALSLSGKEEVLLVGGVALNRRLQKMLSTMCDERGARLAVPKREYLGDNGAMIAYTGKLMLNAGVETKMSESAINPSYRVDQVAVSWRDEYNLKLQHAGRYSESSQIRGAEALISFYKDDILKRRERKSYRIVELDERLIRERTRSEARLLVSARRDGVPTPVIRDITRDTIRMECIRGILLKNSLNSENVREAGRVTGLLHSSGIIHGDLTTSNMIMRKDRCVFIDFGLASASDEVESRGVDIHIFFQTLESSSSRVKELKEAFIEGYKETFVDAGEVLEREHEIVLRGRYL